MKNKGIFIDPSKSGLTSAQVRAMFPLLQRDWLFRWTTLGWVKATPGRVRGKPAYLYPPESISTIRRLVELVTTGHTHKSAFAQYLRQRSEPGTCETPEDLRTLAAGLRSAREQRSLTIADLASRAGVTEGLVQEMETGTNAGAYSAFPLARISRVLGLSLDEQLAHVRTAEERIDEVLQRTADPSLFARLGEPMPPFGRQPLQVRRGFCTVLGTGDVADFKTLVERLWKDPDIGVSERMANYSIGPEPSLQEKEALLRLLGILARKE